MSHLLAVYWVDAFTAEKFTGNPAVIVPEADALSDRQMQLIAREMNCSETAFILRPTHTEADLKLRWFTPTQEVRLCGHATVAAIHTLAEIGQYNIRPGFKQILYLETLSGVLAVTVDFRQKAKPWIWLTLPHCQFDPLPADAVQAIQAALGLTPRMANGMVIDQLNHDVLVQVDSLATLQSLTPNLKTLEALGKTGRWRGFSTFTTETYKPEHHAHLRFFAPQSGIPEDPVTGSASGPLASYLKHQKLVTADRLIFEQGHSLNRPGHIHVDVSDKTLRFGGQAVTVLTGTLNH